MSYLYPPKSRAGILPVALMAAFLMALSMGAVLIGQPVHLMYLVPALLTSLYVLTC